MEGPSAKVFLVVGTHSCGKTALARRFSEAAWVEHPAPTIGLDQEVGSLHVRPDAERLRDDLQVLIPEGGVEVKLWEIGGKDCKHRSAPRGQPINGLILCYDVGDRTSFQIAAHLLLKHRSDRHFAYESASVAGRAETQPRLVVVLCGTKADKADEQGGHVVSTTDQMSFVERSGLAGAFVTSAKTGEGVEEAFQALLLACLEAEEEAEASRLVIASAPPAGEMFSLMAPSAALGPSGVRDLKSMTSPRGLRPHEPQRGVAASPVVEVIDNHGTPYGARLVSSCLELGLLHRVVHVWLYSARSGGLLLRRSSPLAAKAPGQWGPSACGEVLCYNSEPLGQTPGPQSAELSFDTARRVLREQLGFDQTSLHEVQHWGSCTSRYGNIHELIEIYAVDVGLENLPDFQLRIDEGIEWAHFTDVCGNAGVKASHLSYMETAYRARLVQKMRVHVEHVHSGKGLPPVGLARGRPECELPIVASKYLEMTLA